MTSNYDDSFKSFAEMLAGAYDHDQPAYQDEVNLSELSWHHNRGSFTFFSYPRWLADERQLPCDSEAIRFLTAIQKAGVHVAIWGHPIFPADYYFGCPREDIQRLMNLIGELYKQGIFPEGFAAGRPEYLFSLVPTAP